MTCKVKYFSQIKCLEIEPRQLCVCFLMFVVFVRYNKYINTGAGLDGWQWFFPFPLVVFLSVVGLWLYCLLQEQPALAIYSLFAPHNSAGQTQITP